MSETTSTTPPISIPTIKSLPEVDAVDQTEYFDALKDAAAMDAGRGSAYRTWGTYLTRFDRLGTFPFQVNRMYRGMTFITRPKLNLSTRSLKQDDTMQMLNNADPYGFQMAIRSWLDTKFAKDNDYITRNCPFFNKFSAFNIPLMNSLTAISGWPDTVIESYTTRGGYFSEDMSFAVGSTDGRQTTNLTLSCRDFQGGFVMAMLFYYLRSLYLQSSGLSTVYTEDIDAYRLNYTFSIYRFLLDPYRKSIPYWAKATGCWFSGLPTGDLFNFSIDDEYIPTSREFSFPVVANRVEYMNPQILTDFVTVASRYGGSYLKDRSEGKALPDGYVEVPYSASQNFVGMPTIDLRAGANDFVWVAPYSETQSTLAGAVQQAEAALEQQLDTIRAAAANTLAKNGGYIQSKSGLFTPASDSTILI
mgnify:FL=1